MHHTRAILRLTTVAFLVFTATSSVGNFKKAVTYDTGAFGVGAVAIADVNGDGKPDLLVASSLHDSGAVSVLLGNGDGTFQKAVTYESGGTIANSIAVADVSGDGHLDLVVGNFCGSDCDIQAVGVLLGNGDGTFRPVTVQASAGMYPRSVGVADINADGKPDIVTVGDLNTGDCSAVIGILLGNGDGTFQPAKMMSSVGCGGIGIVLADVNGDAKPDLVTLSRCADSFPGCTYPSKIGVLLGKGDGTFEAPRAIDLDVFAHGFASSLTAADVNGDAKPDLLVTYVADKCGNCLNGGVWVLVGNGDGTFQGAVSYGTGESNPTSVIAEDANGDGKLDLIVANQCVGRPDGACETSNVSVRLGNGDGTFHQGWPDEYRRTGGRNAGSLASADLNRDGKPDVVVTVITGAGIGAVGVLLNIRAQTFTALITIPNPSLLGQPVAFTAYVSSGHHPIPDGELVTFYDGATAMASVPLVAGTATFTTASLTAKTHYIKAAYPGSAQFKPSARTIIQIVEKYPTTTTLKSSPRPSMYGQPVTFTATVGSSGPSAPTGKVKFLDAGFAFGSATLNGGVATLTYSKLLVGTHTITAEYLGDAVSARSTSPVLKQVVK